MEKLTPIHHVPILSALHVSIHLLFPTSPVKGVLLLSPLTDEEIEAEGSLSEVPGVMWTVGPGFDPRLLTSELMPTLHAVSGLKGAWHDLLRWQN